VKSYQVANTALSRSLPLVLCGVKEFKMHLSYSCQYIFLGKQKLNLFLYCLVCAFSYTETLVVDSKEVRLEVNFDKTKYMVMS